MLDQWMLCVLLDMSDLFRVLVSFEPLPMVPTSPIIVQEGLVYKG
jgi:hypothetical protein